jgi:RNA polymerase sigma-70 factor, ECF subfamily
MIESPIVLVNKKDRGKSNNLREVVHLINNSSVKVDNPVSLVEKVLVARLSAGDPHAFSSIFSAYYKDLVLFAFRFTREMASAEEIVQDTFVKLWDEHEALYSNTTIRSYLLKIVQNKCIDLYRHKKNIKAYADTILESPPKPDNKTDSYVLYTELKEQIDKALKILPEEIARTFTMSREEGMKYHEIATKLGVSVRTIEVRMGKALSLLRTHLKDYLVILLSLVWIFLS